MHKASKTLWLWRRTGITFLAKSSKRLKKKLWKELSKISYVIFLPPIKHTGLFQLLWSWTRSKNCSVIIEGSILLVELITFLWLVYTRIGLKWSQSLKTCLSMMLMVNLRNMSLTWRRYWSNLSKLSIRSRMLNGGIR